MNPARQSFFGAVAFLGRGWFDVAVLFGSILAATAIHLHATHHKSAWLPIRRPTDLALEFGRLRICRSWGPDIYRVGVWCRRRRETSVRDDDLLPRREAEGNRSHHTAGRKGKGAEKIRRRDQIRTQNPAPKPQKPQNSGYRLLYSLIYTLAGAGDTTKPKN